MFFHAGYSAFSGGFVGVDVFFVISGYLITSLILSEHAAGKFSLAGFYERRARRILPALYFVMIICLPLAWLWLLPSDMKIFAQSVVAVSLFASNILFWRDTGYFAPSAEMYPLLHTWSLAIEEQFYLLFPVFLLLIWQLGKRWTYLTLALVAVCSLALAQWGALSRPSATFFLLPTRGWELLVGASVAMFLFGRDAIPGALWLRNSISAAGVALIIYSVFAFGKQTPFPSLYALVPTVGTASFLLFATPGTVVGKILGQKLPVGLGLISYSAYLWHQPLFAFARHRSMEQPSDAAMAGLILLSIMLAIVSFELIEKPFRDRRLISKRWILGLGITFTIAFLAFGMYVNYSDGLPSRYPGDSSFLVNIYAHDFNRTEQSRFESNQLREFDQSGKSRIMLIGDSYAQELVNALYESGLLDHIQLSTKFISNSCGNLFVSKDFRRNIEEVDLARCNHDGWFEDQRIRKLMVAADQIWLASKWHYWQAELLPESVENLESQFHKRVLVFGLKDFGVVNVKQLIKVPAERRREMRGASSSDSIRINELMKETLPPDVFVDVLALLCGPDSSCPLFTNDGMLISPDGGHLTRFGTIFYAERLQQLPAMQWLSREPK
jgi:peptidoglycan/LPS O-acetylase OafA/YrhL